MYRWSISQRFISSFVAFCSVKSNRNFYEVHGSFSVRRMSQWLFIHNTKSIGRLQVINASQYIVVFLKHIIPSHWEYSGTFEISGKRDFCHRLFLIHTQKTSISRASCFLAWVQHWWFILANAQYPPGRCSRTTRGLAERSPIIRDQTPEYYGILPILSV